MSKITTSTATFCLFDFIREIPNADVAAQVAQSTAWRVDTLIQSAARQLFKSVRQDQFDKGVDSLAELTMALKEQAFAEHAFEEAGNVVTGPVATIKELMVHREAAYNLAADLTALTLDWEGRPKSFAIPDLDDVFFNEVNLKVKSQTKRRIAMSVERRAKAYDLDEAEIKAQIAKRVAREEDKLHDVSQTLQDQSGAVYEMFRQACSVVLDAEVGREFHTMDVASQRTLIESAITAADRAEEYAASSNNITDAEFDDICMCVLQTTKQLKLVLNSSRFKTHAQREAAAAVNVG